MNDFKNMLNEDAGEKDLQKGIDQIMQKKFLEERKIFLWGEIDDKTCQDVTEKLLYLETTDPGKEITVYLNTPGGSVTAGMAVYDTMELIGSPVKVVVTGIAASMGAILLCAAQKGKRFLFPNSRLLIHQPLMHGRMMAAAIDIHIQAQEFEKTREQINRILADASGQPLEKIQQDTDRDFYMSAEEAIAYGLADSIVAEI